VLKGTIVQWQKKTKKFRDLETAGLQDH